jgi:hypothetical protein
MAGPAVASWLTRLVNTGRLTAASALELAKRTFPASVLPQSAAGGLASREARSPFVTAYAGNWKGQGALRLNYSQARRAHYRDILQRDFEKQVRGLAKSVAAGKIPVSVWQSRMADAINAHTIRQASIGRGASISKAEVTARLVPRVHTDLVYLQRFADELALKIATGSPWSADYIAARAARYAGEGRAAWFEEAERAEARPGYVIRYRARDDGYTCDPCRKADGVYLPGDGQFPGRVCLGRARCRCTRELVYDPAAYARLMSDPTRSRQTG